MIQPEGSVEFQDGLSEEKQTLARVVQSSCRPSQIRIDNDNDFQDHIGQSKINIAERDLGLGPTCIIEQATSLNDSKYSFL